MRLVPGQFVVITVRTEFEWKGLKRVKFTSFTGQIHEIHADSIILRGIYRKRRDQNPEHSKNKFMMSKIINIVPLSHQIMTLDEMGLISGKTPYPVDETEKVDSFDFVPVI